MKSTLLAIACLALSVPGHAADFFPLQDGNSWTYRSTTTAETLVVRVGTPVLVNQRQYYPLEGYTPRPVLVRIDERNQLVEVNQQTGVERLLTSFEPSAGVWSAPARECNTQGQTLEKRGVHDGVLGPIQGVLEIRFQVLGCADVGTTFEQYAENLGMVRRIVTTFAGPRVFDLVSAQVGKSELNTLPRASFSVTQQGATQDEMTVLLRLSLESAGELRLAFPTGQEYDVVLHDLAGNVVWRWSALALFTQASHEKVYAGEWTTSIRIPLNTVRPGKYVVQAWLTTTGRDPQFAASLPVTVGVVASNDQVRPLERRR